MTTTAEWRKWNALNTKPVSNADRIRSMTDEELADEFAKIEGDPYNGATIGFWLDWLREEVTDG